ncbi:hypothetical protein B0H13DRAFT_1861903 [Mycena leptocephala]|nr:hypothetical protein B0H13DRAFT_1861903 [Mycena leptocephala]
MLAHEFLRGGEEDQGHCNPDKTQIAVVDDHEYHRSPPTASPRGRHVRGLKLSHGPALPPQEYCTVFAPGKPREGALDSDGVHERKIREAHATLKVSIMHRSPHTGVSPTSLSGAYTVRTAHLSTPLHPRTSRCILERTAPAALVLVHMHIENENHSANLACIAFDLNGMCTKFHEYEELRSGRARKRRRKCARALPEPISKEPPKRLRLRRIAGERRHRILHHLIATACTARPSTPGTKMLRRANKAGPVHDAHSSENVWAEVGGVARDGRDADGFGKSRDEGGRGGVDKTKERSSGGRASLSCKHLIIPHKPSN